MAERRPRLGVAVYVGGPYTMGQQVHNVRRMALLAMKLHKLGFTVYCPLLTHFLDYLEPMGYEDWLAFDMEWLDRCDCMVWDSVECPGESRGAEREVERMTRNGKPVYRSAEFLCRVHGVEWKP